MTFSRMLTGGAIAMLCVSACGGPNTVANNPGTIPSTNSVRGSSQAATAEGSATQNPDVQHRLFWRPDQLMLQKGVKQSAKLFYHGNRPLRIADDCTGKVALDQIGFARIKAYRIKIYDVLALQPGPFHCSVLAKTRGKPSLHAVLHIDVSA
jgi:hypothetical protein